MALLLCLAMLVGGGASAEPDFPFELRTTSIVLGPEEQPRAVVRFALTRPVAGPVELRAMPIERSQGGAHASERFRGRRSADREERRGDPTGYVVVSPTSVGADAVSLTGPWRSVPHGADPPPASDADLRALASGERWLAIPAPLPLGEEELVLSVSLHAEGAWWERWIAYRRPSLDWTVHLVPGFHYDPVWWNTQAHYTETGRFMGSHVGPGLELVEAYLEECVADPDYRVALHQLPYLKTFCEARPERADALRELVRRGQAGAVGGTYNELSSTLVSAEAVARNAIHGALFQREVLGGAGDAFWQCDVFGHDPSFPALMASAGLSAGAFARGPFHQWGAPRDQVTFPSEFLWTAPDGTSVLAHYMTGHYGYAYGRLANGSNVPPADRAVTNALLADMFEDLKRPALTHHVLLPMHMDFVRPLEDLGEIVDAWNAAHVSPRVVLDTGEGFFDAVRREIDERRLVPPVVTRDMNPIYTGCQVSFADLKLANRAAEAALREAEVAATLAALCGAEYPSLALDRAWRQLLFNAHHDGVTGSMSDQVYVDVLAGYRDALDLATGVRERARAWLAERVDTSGSRRIGWNATGTERAGWAATAGGGAVEVEAVPALGWAALGPPPDSRADSPAGTRTSELVLENEHLRLAVDPARGGAIATLVDRASGRELLRGPANDVALLEEYPVLPGHGEGPWHLAPTGARRPGTDARARVLPPDPARPHRLVVEADYPDFSKRQTLELLPGARRVDCETWILDWSGSDRLLRVELPVDLPGARPLFETAAAVVGRPFARDVDTARDAWTLDQAAAGWAGLGAASWIELRRGGEPVHRRALGVGELVVPDGATAEERELANRLARALVRAGVTTSVGEAGARRYGDLALDSNVPDFRVLVGSGNALARAARELHGPDVAWVEDGRDLPRLLVEGERAAAALVEQLESAQHLVLDAGRAAVAEPALPPLAGFAVLTRGPASFHVEEGLVALNLLRSCTSWPSGTWMDPPARRLPDRAPFGTMHGSHVFRYALLPFAGDFRAAEVSRRAHEVAHPLVAAAAASHPGELPARAGLLSVEPAGVQVAALKVAGFPEARWRVGPWTPPDAPDPRFRESSAAGPRRIALRLWNGTGRRAEARVVLGELGRRLALSRAWRADLLERPGEELAFADGALALELAPNAYETLLLEVAPFAHDPLSSLEPERGPSPSAYWLENRGEGVDGNGVVALAPSARALVLADGVARGELRLVNGDRASSALFRLSATAPAGFRVELPRSVNVPPASFLTTPLVVRAPDGGAQGFERALVTVRAEPTGLPAWELTAGVWVVAPGVDAATAPLAVRNDASVAAAGGRLAARVENLTDGPLPATARWLAPMSLWGALPDPRHASVEGASWTSEVEVPARGEVRLELPVGDAQGGWALLELLCGGAAVYGEAVAVVRDPERLVLAFDADRVRLRPGAAGSVRLVAASARGLERDAELRVAAPAGFAVRETGRELVQERGDARRLVVDLEVTAAASAAAGAAQTGELTAVGPRGARAAAAYTVTPELAARPLAGAPVRVDARLREWDDAEFAGAASELGPARCAARWSPEGLAFALVVEDGDFRQPHANGSIWEGDSVQLALTAAPSSSFGYGGDILELGAALSPEGPLVWSWYGGADGVTGRLDGAQVAVANEDGRTWYELFLPRALLPGLPLEPGARLGFAWIANDDDGQGHRGAVQWTGGMSGGKDASLFGELELGE